MERDTSLEEATPSRTDQFLEKAAIALKWMWVATWLIHCHIFWLLALMIDRFVIGDQMNETSEALLDALSFVPGPLITPGVVIIIVNNVAGAFDEIQSYQIAYIIWGVCVALIYSVYIFWSNTRDPPPSTKSEDRKMSHDPIVSSSTTSLPTGSPSTSPEASVTVSPDVAAPKKEEAEAESHEEQFCKLLLLPFGFHSKDVGDSFNFTVPLVSLAPAIVGGYIANFILAKTYSLECDEIYNSFATICDKHGVCCITVSNHDNVFDFVPDLVASMLAGWGIVKATAFLIITYDEEMELIEEEELARQRSVSRSKTV